MLNKPLYYLKDINKKLDRLTGRRGRTESRLDAAKREFLRLDALFWLLLGSLYCVGAVAALMWMLRQAPGLITLLLIPLIWYHRMMQHRL